MNPIPMRALSPSSWAVACCMAARPAQPVKVKVVLKALAMVARMAPHARAAGAAHHRVLAAVTAAAE